MEIPLFLAMTAAEFRSAEALPAHPVWMACHFSSYGTGLSNIPRGLTPGCMLMLNDRTPICGHDPEDVAKTLCQAADALECDSILLDFQRADCDELTDVVQAVLGRSVRPVGISALYAHSFDCPVLVPPIPPQIIPKEALSVWQGREIWLELSTEGTEIIVTEEGSRYTPLPGFIPHAQAHPEAELCCHYEIQVEEGCIHFHLGRTNEDQAALIGIAKACGTTKALALWQEMKEPAAFATGSKEIG